MDTTTLVLLATLLLLPCLSIVKFISPLRATCFPTLRNQRICVLIAHPDDEAMFFAPTVLALTRPETGNHLILLCLSSGDAQGLGDTRKKELVKSSLLLGLKGEEDVFVVDIPDDFPDTMMASWSTEKISFLLRKAFLPDSSSSKPSSSDPSEVTLDVLITFDSRGVSCHPNHTSLYHGAQAFITSLTQNKLGWRSPVDLYTLTSVNIFRKYAGVLDVFTTLGATALGTWKGGSETNNGNHPTNLVYVHGLGRPGWTSALQAMTEAHVSQMTWFRHS